VHANDDEVSLSVLFTYLIQTTNFVMSELMEKREVCYVRTNFVMLV